MRQVMKCRVTPGKTIKQILQGDYLMSRALITALKKIPDGILVNGEKKYVNYVLKEGDCLRVTFEETGSINIEPVCIPIDILYEDDFLLAVNKPAYMAVHVSHGNVYDTLSNAVLYYLNKDGSEHTFHVATRLDKNTSGVVLIAKNSYAHDLLSRQLRNKTFYKEYIAVVCGKMSGSGTINQPIARECDSIIKRCVRPDGEEAVTDYQVIDTDDENSLVRIVPKTGRTHQIRVHMSYMGHPIAGDDMYGAEKITQGRHLLHAHKISFVHPFTKQILEITAPLSTDFFENFQKLENYY